MIANFENILFYVGSGILLIAGVFILKGVLKIAWRFVRIALIVVSLMLIAGFALGLLKISFPWTP